MMNTMKMTKQITKAFLVVCLYSAVACNTRQPQPDDVLPIKAKAIHVPNGWGYEVYVDGRLFIHQETIPAISGNKPFTSEADAFKTASFIVNKIAKKEKPTLEYKDLQYLAVKGID